MLSLVIIYVEYIYVGEIFYMRFGGELLVYACISM